MRVDRGQVEAAKVLSKSKAFKEIFNDIIDGAERSGGIEEFSTAVGLAGAYLQTVADLAMVLDMHGVKNADIRRKLLSLIRLFNNTAVFDDIVERALESGELGAAKDYMEVLQGIKLLRRSLLGDAEPPSDEEIKRGLQL